MLSYGMCIVRDTRLTFGAGIAVAFLHVLKSIDPLTSDPVILRESRMHITLNLEWMNYFEASLWFLSYLHSKINLLYQA